MISKRRFSFIFCLTVVICLLLFPFIAASEKKVFNIVTEPYEPYIGHGLKSMGWTAEVARAALASEGYTTNIDLVPWARALNDSKQGRYDGLYLAFYTKERTAWFVYSNPIGQVRTGFFKLKKRKISFKNLSDLKPYYIGITRGAAFNLEFDKADYLHKNIAVNDSQLVARLLFERIDLLAGTELVIQNLINVKFPDEKNKIEFIEPPLTINQLHLAISKKTVNFEQKLADFNRGLKRIQDNGTYQKILNKFGF